MAGFSARAQLGIFQLNEVADVGLGTQHTARSQAGKRTAVGTLTHIGAVEMAVGFNDGALAQDAVLDHAVGADVHAILDHHLAFEDHVDVDQHVATHSNFATQIEARRIDQGHTLSHQAAASAVLIMALELRQLNAVVGT